MSGLKFQLANEISFERTKEPYCEVSRVARHKNFVLGHIRHRPNAVIITCYCLVLHGTLK